MSEDTSKITLREIVELSQACATAQEALGRNVNRETLKTWIAACLAYFEATVKQLEPIVMSGNASRIDLMTIRAARAKISFLESLEPDILSYDEEG